MMIEFDPLFTKQKYENEYKKAIKYGSSFPAFLSV